MSELSEVFGFQQEDGQEPDFDAIFGGGEPTVAPSIPIEEPKTTDIPAAEFPAADVTTAEPQTNESAAATTGKAAKPETPKTTEKAKTKSKTKEPEAEPDLFSAFNAQADTPEPPTQSTEAAPAAAGQVSLFDKAPIFSYGSAKEPIEDASITFEELRIRKADDFPELESGKSVSWRVRYGAVTKSVADPKADTVAKLKEEIERSKAFLDGLKKAKNDKDRNPDCLVSPVVIAKSKGIAAYAGVFPSVEAARASDKVICILPANDGKIYEMRKSELSYLTLSDRHRANLRERGLSDERIEENGYKSMPERAADRRLLAKLVRMDHDLLGIPGFYTRYGDWTLAGPNGFLIPVRDKDGLIQGLKIRLGAENNPERKYRWLSSRDKHLPNGTRSYSWVHVTGDRTRRRAFITEGPLKGDVASFLAKDALFVCTGGVNATRGLKEAIERLGVTEVVEAMDMDQMVNPQVRNGILAMRKEVMKIPNIKYSKYTWNPAYKGVDDYFLSRVAAM